MINIHLDKPGVLPARVKILKTPNDQHRWHFESRYHEKCNMSFFLLGEIIERTLDTVIETCSQHLRAQLIQEPLNLYKSIQGLKRQY